MSKGQCKKYHPLRPLRIELKRIELELRKRQTRGTWQQLEENQNIGCSFETPQSPTRPDWRAMQPQHRANNNPEKWGFENGFTTDQRTSSPKNNTEENQIDNAAERS